MPPTYSPHPATHVLDYLKRMETRAAEKHNRFAALHYSLVHAFIFDHVFGDIPDFSYHVPKPPMECYTGPRKMTAGQVEMLQRPLRKIIRVMEHDEREPKSRLRYTVRVEILECGHQMPARAVWFDEPPAKRRRCAGCAKPARAVQVQLAKRAHA